MGCCAKAGRNGGEGGALTSDGAVHDCAVLELNRDCLIAQLHLQMSNEGGGQPWFGMRWALRRAGAASPHQLNCRGYLPKTYATRTEIRNEVSQDDTLVSDPPHMRAQALAGLRRLGRVALDRSSSPPLPGTSAYTRSYPFRVWAEDWVGGRGCVVGRRCGRGEEGRGMREGDY